MKTAMVPQKKSTVPTSQMEHRCARNRRSSDRRSGAAGRVRLTWVEGPSRFGGEKSYIRRLLLEGGNREQAEEG